MPIRVFRLRLTRAVAQERIRKIAQDSSNIILEGYAKQRMAEREIVRRDIDRALISGFVDGDPEPAEEGEWKCKVVYPVRGRRDLGVVVIILRSNELFVKTVEWEDPK